MLIEQAKSRQTIRKFAISKRKRGKKRTKKQQSEQHKSLKNLIYCWQKRWLMMISVTANDNNNHHNKWNKSNIFHDNLFGFFLCCSAIFTTFALFCVWWKSYSFSNDSSFLYRFANFSFVNFLSSHRIFQPFYSINAVADYYNTLSHKTFEFCVPATDFYRIINSCIELECLIY